ncbi:MAG: hypothetical protein MJE68_32790 [Proteobacteria bacterium]|nr:hypothetical protein [Pseudomonadota bacterium]
MIMSTQNLLPVHFRELSSTGRGSGRGSSGCSGRSFAAYLSGAAEILSTLW